MTSTATTCRWHVVTPSPKSRWFIVTHSDAVFATVSVGQHRLAQGPEGFWWQLEGSGPGHPALRQHEPRHVVNVSAWVDYASLHAFVYRSAHGHALLRRSDWFEAIAQPSTALWWVPADAMPALETAVARLTYLRRYGPSPRAFTVRRRFDQAGRPERRAGRL